ncbi:MAG TPA: hypothetical protein VJL90_00980 [Pseudorhodoplanes sp.]|nr:hypothetical protein [Pseudorhodoplanes sp.]
MIRFLPLAVILLAGGLTSPAAQPQSLCAECLSVRIGPPTIVRGPTGMESDAPFVAIKLRDGTFRGFTSNHRTHAIEGATPVDMGGPKRVVMQPGRKGTLSDCGNWLTGVLPVDGKLVGLVHGESDCDYDKGRTHKAMAIATSADEGLTWNFLGAIITHIDKATAGKMTGEGDCTMADGHDGFLYVYCLRPSDWKITVARAPRGNIAPGQWMKWDGAGWRTPALDRAGAPLAGFPGHSAAFFAPKKLMLLLAVSKSLKLSFSSDKINFTQLPAPLIIYDTDEWNRPAPDALYAYPSLVGENGTNTLGERGWLTYAYVPPNEDFTQRYLVVHEIALTPHASAQSPQVRTALSRYKSDAGRLWSTVAPAIEKRPNTFKPESVLGNVMTARPALPSEQLEECVRETAGAMDYRLTNGACEAPFKRQRTAGFVYRDAQPGTVALYACVARQGLFHFASTQENCEGLGASEKRLGFVLK